MFDPSLGRWLTEDPIDYAGGDQNLYKYVGNNPLNGVDPTGLRKEPPPGRPQLQQQPTHTPSTPVVLPPRGTPLTIKGEFFMIAFGIQKYTSFWSLTLTDYYRHLERGCVGLNAIRLGLTLEQSQAAILGLRCFKTLTEAQAAQLSHKDRDKQSVIFAAQSDKPPAHFEQYLLAGSSSEYDARRVISAIMGTTFDFLTAILNTNSDVMIWEHMQFGQRQNPTLDVEYIRDLPNLPTTVYCTCQIPKHAKAPPIIDDRNGGPRK